MSKTWSKVFIGLGAGYILISAVALGKGLGIWSMHTGYILGGMLFVHLGITSILGVTDRKVIRGLRFGLAGVAIVFIVVGLVMLVRSQALI